jgi:gluconolactonase
VTGFRVLAQGIGFTEGPLWTAAGELLVTSMSRGLVYRVALDGAPPTVAAETGGGPNGLAQAADGTVYCAQNGNATVQSRSPRSVVAGLQTIRPDGEVADLLGDCLAPNDIVVGPDGLVWFTDPDPAGGAGAVRTLDPVTGEVLTPIDDVAFPNGIAFDAAGRLLVADTAGDAILRYTVARGAASGRELLGWAPGGPDGIAFDADGRLYVAAFDDDEVRVLEPDGAPGGSFALPAGTRPTNLCFAGLELDTLVVTAASGGRVLALDGRVRGRAVTPG